MNVKRLPAIWYGFLAVFCFVMTWIVSSALTHTPPSLLIVLFWLLLSLGASLFIRWMDGKR